MLVVIYAPPDARAMGPVAVFELLAAANTLTTANPRYEVRLVTDRAEPLPTTSGARLMPDMAIGDCTMQADMLIVAAGRDQATAPDPAVVEWLRGQVRGAQRYGSIGNGAFYLGAAGLLDGKRVAVHQEHADALVARFPAALVERDSIYVRDDGLFSCAGGMATADLLLALIEEDHGREVALRLARRFVMFMKRSGGQAQVSNLLSTQTATRDPIQRVQQHIYDNPTGDLSVAALAAVAAMSPRNFTRVFRQQTGLRPTDFIERGRVNFAKHLMEESAYSPQQIARLAGFSGSEAARRAFRRQTGETMNDYRATLPPRAPEPNRG
ncbi:GlxA family transcriptional regulator [Sphingomonas solaris]|nr:helix-turn-helix domain-containing protein [Sphingomonas solaris]